MFVDLDWPLNASSLLSASAELLVFPALLFGRSFSSPAFAAPCGNRATENYDRSRSAVFQSESKCLNTGKIVSHNKCVYSPNVYNLYSKYAYTMHLPNYFVSCSTCGTWLSVSAVSGWPLPLRFHVKQSWTRCSHAYAHMSGLMVPHVGYFIHQTFHPFIHSFIHAQVPLS